ncbi:cell wall mannoprotein 1 family protein [Aspergillus neoniger CBS 115656]|uniref:Antigenic cell wall galactomanno protein n=1 Tax=Aspergillus neoniger (strain CBS 115656) TaxID=1448310 RepID=A0A318YQS9_ASPNB|nr:antigenic cell wall galactomanno protein [Aspergillus neoniger CBS 115656]PYH35113.1 antigenic cell wall galactomanno protein [Aspergillus neoniger CBS 115656]
MNFLYLLTLLFTATVAVATATPAKVLLPTKRDGSSVVSAVNTISTQLITLNTTVSNYPGGIEGTLSALQIQAETIQLEVDLKTAIKVTRQSANFTDTESQKVAEAFVTLEPQIASTLANIVSKKSDFDDGLLGIASLSFLVKFDLQELSILSKALGSAVQDKLSGTYAELAPLILNEISAAFKKAIAAYS